MRKQLALILTLVLLCGITMTGTAEETVYKLPDYEITGDTVTLLTWGGTTKTLCETEGAEYYDIDQLLQKYYGCKLKIIRTTYEELPIKAASLVLAGEAPDLIKYKDQDNPSFVQQNLVAEVSPYVDWNDPLWAGVKETAEMWKYGDKYYMLPYTEFENNSYIYYWTDMFEEAGLETPYELYLNGEWTVSKLQELMIDLTCDNDRDGIVDVYGLTMHPSLTYFCTGEDFVKTDPETGLLVNNMRSAAFTPFFDFIYNTGTAGDNTRLMSWDMIAHFENRDAAILWEESWVRSQLAEKIRNGEVGIAPSPRMDGTDTTYALGKAGVYWIGNGCKNPGGAAAFLALERFRNLDPELKAEKDAINDAKYQFPDEIKAMIEEMSDPEKFSLMPAKGYGVGNWGNDGQWVLWEEANNWEVPWQTLLETHYPVMQAEIDVANANFAKMSVD